MYVIPTVKIKLDTFFNPSTPVHFIGDIKWDASRLQRNCRIAVYCWSWKYV